MTNLDALAAANAKRWERARLTRDFTAVARLLVSPVAKGRYQSVAVKTGVPWVVIAVIHERECAQDWTRSLAQGDPWNRVSVHVPAGRGPFASWEAAAADALVDCAPYVARNADWSIGATLARLEQYNGLGYAARGVASPYLWSGTDQYRSGKYVRDGVYDPKVVDRQLGCAGLLKAMAALDRSATPANEKWSAAPTVAAPVSSPSEQPRSNSPSLKNPSKGSVGAFLATIAATLFKWR